MTSMKELREMGGKREAGTAEDVEGDE